jgi:hypothetical protein
MKSLKLEIPYSSYKPIPLFAKYPQNPFVEILCKAKMLLVQRSLDWLKLGHFISNRGMSSMDIDDIASFPTKLNR